MNDLVDNTAPPSPDYERQLRDMNEALLVSSIRQHELTEQAQKAEEELRETQHRLEFTLETVQGGPWDLNLLTGKAQCSFRHDQCFGATEPIPDWSYEKFLTYVHPDDRAKEDRKFRAAVATGQDWAIDCRVVWPDGSVHWIESSGRNYRYVGGKPTRMLGMVRDVTERKHAEEATARLVAIVTSSEDAIISKDLDGVITSWNKGAERLFGYAAEEVIGQSVTLLIPHDHLDEEPYILGRIRRGEVVEHYETVRRRKDGSLLDISLTVSPLRNAGGRIIGASKIARDITDRRRLEKQMQEQAAALSDLHRRKDEFLAMLSHELRNPLAPIANAVQLLRLAQRSENPIEQQARAIIERQVGQLKHLVDDLLEVSRITTGRIQLRRERVAVGGIVDRALETARPLFQQRRHEFTMSLPSEPIWLYADAARLEQVMVNLLTNAAKYTEEGGHIRLTVQQEGETAGLRVRDTGVGIAPELLPHIFDLFTQAERSLDRSEGGLGIGLCLVQRLVELHGGTTEVSSVLGQGSEFVVRLPVMPTSAPQPRATTTESAQPIASLRVLVVDDNVDTAQSLALLLKASGHDARTAHDGPTALEAALDYQPDVMLLDIGLPGLNGFEVAKRIRQQPTLKNLVLVAMTGYGQEADRQRSHETGFNIHLVKPADFKDLQRILASVSEKTR